MKTHVLKKVTLFFVVLFAVGLAFVSNAKENAGNSTIVDGYVYQNNECQKVTTCSTIPGPLCTYNDMIASEYVSQTECGSALFSLQ